MKKNLYSCASMWTLFLAYFSCFIQPLESLECSSGTVKFGQICYKQINGCLRYKSGTQCIQCQLNFNIYQGSCWISNEQVNIIFLQNSQKKKNNNIKGQSDSIQLTETNVLKLNKIQYYLSYKYSNISFTINQPVIKNILSNPFDTYFSFVWTNEKNITFLFEISIDLNQNITQYLIQKLESSIQLSLFSKVNDNLIKKYDKKLLQSTLFRIISVSKNLYKFHYYSDFGSHYIAFIQKIPFLQIKPLQTAPWQYNQTEIFNYIISQHAFLAKQTQYDILIKPKTKNPQYQITLGSQSKIVVEQIPSQKYRIIFLYRQQSKTLNQSSSSKLVGGYQIFKDNQDQIIRKVLNHLISQFKFLEIAQITKIQYQIVAGTNFLIHLQDSQNNNEYMCKIFYSLSGQINILQIYLNSIIIHTQPLSPVQLDPTYNYNLDPLFPKILQNLKQVKKLNLPTFIMYANKEQKSNQNDNFYQYDIVYEQNSFIIVNYFYSGSKKDTISIVDLIINGDNQYENQNIQKASTQIKIYLEQSKKWIHPLLMEYIKETKPNEYFCKIITQYGSYFYKVIQKNSKQFQVYYLQLVDDQENCMKLSNDDIILLQQTHKQFLFDLLKNQNIPFVSQLVSLSKGIIDSKTLYRLLYKNPQTNKKTQIILRQQADSIVLQSKLDENNGFQLITDQDLYKKIVQKDIVTYYDTLKNSSKTIVGIKNSQKFLVYFAVKSTKQVIYQVQLDIKQQKSSIRSFFERQISKNCQKFDDKGNCKQCKENQISLFSNCYLKIKNCTYQLGDKCLMCDGQFTLMNNQCINDCRQLI